MTHSCFRITKRERAASAFDGEGARLFGGRWNSKGGRVVYTSQSRSLAILEMLVHLDSHEILARNYCVIPARFPESICEIIEVADLPRGWDADMPGRVTREVGDLWLREKRSAVLAVPSALAASEWNYLLNPEHKDFRRVRISPPEDFAFSKRFLK